MAGQRAFLQVTSPLIAERDLYLGVLEHFHGNVWIMFYRPRDTEFTRIDLILLRTAGPDRLQTIKNPDELLRVAAMKFSPKGLFPNHKALRLTIEKPSGIIE